MRPPMQSAALQQNESAKHHQHQHQVQQQQQQLQQQFHTQTTVVAHVNATNADTPPLQGRKPKIQPREVLVENQLNFACSVAPSAILPPAAPPVTTRNTKNLQEHFVHSGNNYRSRPHDHHHYPEVDDDSIQLVDLSSSPPPAAVLTSHSQVLRRAPIKRSSVGSDCQYSRSSSSDDGSLNGDRLLHYTRPNTYDDAAEGFIINFPSESPLHNPNDSVTNLPLSETEPLLTNIEATVADTQRAICLSKNSASLIFTKKEVPRAGTATRYYSPVAAPTATSNNNCSSQRCAPNNSFNSDGKNSTTTTTTTIQSRSQHSHNLASAHERNRKHSKHLPATYHQQQRRSLQLNYNNNLVTTSTCNANNNFCCTAAGSSTSKGVGGGGAVLHKHHSGLTSPVAASTTATATRKQHAYSWYAPVYSALEEELEQDSRDSSPIHNLANTKKQHSNHYQQRSVRNSSTAADNETVALLETRNQINIQPQLHAPTNRELTSVQSHSQARRSKSSVQPPTSLPLQNNAYNNATANNVGSGSGSGSGGGSGDFSSVTSFNSCDVEGPLAGSLGLAGGPLPRRRRFENFLKSLVGLKPSSSGRNGSIGGDASTVAAPGAPHTQLPASPEITITRTPSEQNMVVMREPSASSVEKLATNGGHQGSTSSLNVVQQKLWNIMRREGSAASLHQEKSQSIVQYTGLRKCETVLALTRQSTSLCSPVHGTAPDFARSVSGGMHMGSGIFNASGVEQIRPLNRLRNSVTSVNATCSRCSSLLSLAASGSRYSLNASANGGASSFVNMIPSSTSQQQLRTPPPLIRHQQPQPQAQLQTQSQNQAKSHHLRSNVASSSNIISCSSSRDNNDSDAPAHVAPPNGNACRSSDNCSRKSSGGANSSHNASSTSPPSNMTTVTFNSSIISSTSPSTITTPTPVPIPKFTPTPTVATALQPNPDISANMLVGLPTELPSCTPTTSPSALPFTVTSLLSVSSAEERDVAKAGVTAPSSSAAPSGARKSSLKPHQQKNQQHQPQPQTYHGAYPFHMFTCKLCLVEVESASEATTLLECACHFCTECMKAYVDFEISEGAYEISCPDAQCPEQGSMTLPEIANLTTANLMKKHHRYRLNREIEMDKTRTWCPRAGCETVCLVTSGHQPDGAPSTSASIAAAFIAASGAGSSGGDIISQMFFGVQCPSCKDEFCAACKKSWHPNISCEENSRRLVADGQDDIGIPFDNDLIKCCPMCAVPIEKDEGCAQMMCKRCKHVFCWYCLASLDDDFLLRHYDKGPCKNKLGHSRASVVWHRAQVIGIFAGFGILLLVASPLLLLAAPCIICCKCRSCSGSKIDEGDGDLDEATALQS